MPGHGRYLASEGPNTCHVEPADVKAQHHLTNPANPAPTPPTQPHHGAPTVVQRYVSASSRQAPDRSAHAAYRIPLEVQLNLSCVSHHNDLVTT